MLRAVMKNIKNVIPALKQTSNTTVTSPMSDCDPAPELDTRIIWVDMEMSGLDISQDRILELACTITDANLKILAEGPDLIIHQSSYLLDNMNEWCAKQHGKTGLTKACLQSKISERQAEQTILDFLTKNGIVPKTCPLAGNSISTDRLFLKKFMPTLNNFIHYRIIDVSSVKELCRRWNPDVYNNVPKKEFNHRALADILESIKELEYYRKYFFVKTVR